MAQLWKIGTRLQWSEILNKKLKRLQGGYNSLDDAQVQSDYNHVVIGRDGLCVVYQCAGISHRTCETCNPRRMAGYQKMENERYRAEHPHESVERDIDQYNSLLLNFYLESATVPEFCPLLVTKHMTAYDAVKGVALNQKNENPHMFTIVEHWKDFEAERVLEDHELIQNVRREQVKFYNNKFVFIYRSDLEKYEYVRDKEDYFVHPDVVRSKSPKKSSEDPLLIQVEDPFYSKKLITISNASLFASPSETSENVVESINAIETIPEELPERDLVNPIFCGTVYIKQSHKDMTIEEIEKLPERKEKAQWPKKYLLLRNKTLYLVNNHQNMVKFYHFDDERFNEVEEKNLWSVYSTNVDATSWRVSAPNKQSV